MPRELGPVVLAILVATPAVGASWTAHAGPSQEDVALESTMVPLARPEPIALKAPLDPAPELTERSPAEAGAQPLLCDPPPLPVPFPTVTTPISIRYRVGCHEVDSVLFAPTLVGNVLLTTVLLPDVPTGPFALEVLAVPLGDISQIGAYGTQTVGVRFGDFSLGFNLSSTPGGIARMRMYAQGVPLQGPLCADSAGEGSVGLLFTYELLGAQGNISNFLFSKGPGILTEDTDLLFDVQPRVPITRSGDQRNIDLDAQGLCEDAQKLAIDVTTDVAHASGHVLRCADCHRFDVSLAEAGNARLELYIEIAKSGDTQVSNLFFKLGHRRSDLSGWIAMADNLGSLRFVNAPQLVEVRYRTNQGAMDNLDVGLDFGQPDGSLTYHRDEDKLLGVVDFGVGDIAHGSLSLDPGLPVGIPPRKTDAFLQLHFIGEGSFDASLAPRSGTDGARDAEFSLAVSGTLGEAEFAAKSEWVGGSPFHVVKRNYTLDHDGVLSGWLQVPGVGKVTAERALRYTFVEAFFENERLRDVFIVGTDAPPGGTHMTFDGAVKDFEELHVDLDALSSLWIAMWGNGETLRLRGKWDLETLNADIGFINEAGEARVRVEDNGKELDNLRVVLDGTNLARLRLDYGAHGGGDVEIQINPLCGWLKNLPYDKETLAVIETFCKLAASYSSVAFPIDPWIQVGANVKRVLPGEDRVTAKVVYRDLKVDAEINGVSFCPPCHFMAEEFATTFSLDRVVQASSNDGYAEAQELDVLKLRPPVGLEYLVLNTRDAGYTWNGHCTDVGVIWACSHEPGPHGQPCYDSSQFRLYENGRYAGGCVAFSDEVIQESYLGDGSVGVFDNGRWLVEFNNQAFPKVSSVRADSQHTLLAYDAGGFGGSCTALSGPHPFLREWDDRMLSVKFRPAGSKC